MADAAAFGSMLSILMVLYPERAALIVGLTESLFALGYTIGKKSGTNIQKTYFFIKMFLFKVLPWAQASTV